ncbi:hypothetical protein B1757_13895 [Acidithiobacillus marinus]|uniref:Uncharacterized protein n=1 Tax=Acidithiobacillus marinus TaxID=187490 RepID=A0A2I1DII8_9PROT|nr:hypothetical protein [Acidithiobacillus marinus]PKY09690.1 hypothetical protein B1757_13895 [Acidithiobacillus marinus]
MAAERQAQAGQISVAAALRGSLTYFKFRFLKRPHNVKIRNLRLSEKQRGQAFELMEVDGFIDRISDNEIYDFTEDHVGYGLGFAGRSGGYLCLTEVYFEGTGYRSWCRSCRQRNYCSVLDADALSSEELAIANKVIGNGGVWFTHVYLEESEIKALDMPEDEKIKLINHYKNQKWLTVSNRCGKCGANGEQGRVNYIQQPLRKIVRPLHVNKDDFHKMSADELKVWTDLVCDFDWCCDLIRMNLIDATERCRIVEEDVQVTKTIRTIQCI